MTRTSRAIASSILRKFSACASCLRLEFDAVELGHAVDQLGHRLAEALGDLLLGDRGVLHHVVQQRGHHRLRVELPVGEDLGDRERMRDVGVAALPELALVGGVAELVGLLDAADVARLEVAEVLPQVADGDGGHGLAFAPHCSARRRARSGEAADVAGCSRRGSGGRAGRRARGEATLAGVHAAQVFDADLARGDLAQRDHGGLVARGLDRAACRPGRAGARGRSPRASAGSGWEFFSGNLRR